MPAKSTLLLCTCAALIVVSPARAADCPVEGAVAVRAALDKAPTCDAAMTIFGSCGFGSMIDVTLGGIVIEKCEADFLPRLAASRRKAYGREQKACERKYARETGSLYRSEEAFCYAELARKYARRFGSEKAAGRRK